MKNTGFQVLQELKVIGNETERNKFFDFFIDSKGKIDVQAIINKVTESVNSVPRELKTIYMDIESEVDSDNPFRFDEDYVEYFAEINDLDRKAFMEQYQDDYHNYHRNIAGMSNIHCVNEIMEREGDELVANTVDNKIYFTTHKASMVLAINAISTSFPQLKFVLRDRYEFESHTSVTLIQKGSICNTMFADYIQTKQCA